MKHGSTLILRGTILLIGLVVLGLCVGLGFLIADGKQNYHTPIWLGLCVAAIPFFIALQQSLKLLGFIDKNTAFSQQSVTVLKNIKYCALIISGLFAVGMPYIFYAADRDDSPGFVAMALVIMGASFVIATFAGVLQKLLVNAIAIKKENDLTV